MTPRIQPYTEDAQGLPFTPLSAQEAQALRESQPPISLMRVLMAQAVVGILAALVAGALTGRQSVAISTGYGALSAFLPTLVFARGMTSRFSSLNAYTSLIGFFVWEMVKLAVCFVMLFTANRWVENLSWLALLAGLVLTMKVNWLALTCKSVFQSKAKVRTI
ncbi:MAG: ATP synthase subunit I [Limnohabitans sp.]|nr:ATP synthase subunit I [Limnohabitans sp.]